MLYIFQIIYQYLIVNINSLTYFVEYNMTITMLYFFSYFNTFSKWQVDNLIIIKAKRKTVQISHQHQIVEKKKFHETIYLN